MQEESASPDRRPQGEAEGDAKRATDKQPEPGGRRGPGAGGKVLGKREAPSPTGRGDEKRAQCARPGAEASTRPGANGGRQAEGLFPTSRRGNFRAPRQNPKPSLEPRRKGSFSLPAVAHLLDKFCAGLGSTRSSERKLSAASSRHHTTPGSPQRSIQI